MRFIRLTQTDHEGQSVCVGAQVVRSGNVSPEDQRAFERNSLAVECAAFLAENVERFPQAVKCLREGGEFVLLNPNNWRVA